MFRYAVQTGRALRDAPETHSTAQELRELTVWSEEMVWCSPERHGAMTGIMKAQIDWIPLTMGTIRPTQRKIFAVMEELVKFTLLTRHVSDLLVD